MRRYLCLTDLLTIEIENEGDGLLEFEVTRILDKASYKNIAWLTIDPLKGVVK